jgi:hypothetical protein
MPSITTRELIEIGHEWVCSQCEYQFYNPGCVLDGLTLNEIIQHVKRCVSRLSPSTSVLPRPRPYQEQHSIRQTLTGSMNARSVPTLCDYIFPVWKRGTSVVMLPGRVRGMGDINGHGNPL